MLFSAVLYKKGANILEKEVGNKMVHFSALKGTEIEETNENCLHEKVCGCLGSESQVLKYLQKWVFQGTLALINRPEL